MKKPKLSDQEKGLLKLKNDPSLFVREVLGAEPELWQAEALKAIPAPWSGSQKMNA